MSCLQSSKKKMWENLEWYNWKVLGLRIKILSFMEKTLLLSKMLKISMKLLRAFVSIHFSSKLKLLKLFKIFEWNVMMFWRWIFLTWIWKENWYWMNLSPNKNLALLKCFIIWRVDGLKSWSKSLSQISRWLEKGGSTCNRLLKSLMTSEN